MVCRRSTVAFSPRFARRFDRVPFCSARNRSGPTASVVRRAHRWSTHRNLQLPDVRRRSLGFCCRCRTDDGVHDLDQNDSSSRWGKPIIHGSQPCWSHCFAQTGWSRGSRAFSCGAGVEPDSTWKGIPDQMVVRKTNSYFSKNGVPSNYRLELTAPSRSRFSFARG